MAFRASSPSLSTLVPVDTVLRRMKDGNGRILWMTDSLYVHIVYSFHNTEKDFSFHPLLFPIFVILYSFLCD